MGTFVGARLVLWHGFSPSVSQLLCVSDLEPPASPDGVASTCDGAAPFVPLKATPFACACDGAAKAAPFCVPRLLPLFCGIPLFCAFPLCDFFAVWLPPLRRLVVLQGGALSFCRALRHFPPCTSTTLSPAGFYPCGPVTVPRRPRYSACRPRYSASFRQLVSIPLLLLC